MNNVVLSTRNIDDFINDMANEVVKRINAVKNEDTSNLNIDQILTVPEAADLLKLSTASIYRLISKNELSHMKRSKRVYFMRSDLISYLQAGKRKTLLEIENEANHYLTDKKRAR